MALRIDGSISNLVHNTDSSRLQRLTEQLSSGQQINRAADDPAGLIISEQLRAQVTGIDQAAENATTASNLANTADGALSGASDLLNRARELLVAESNTGANDEGQSSARREELGAIREQLDRIGSDTRFGDEQLLDEDREYSFQIGPSAGNQASLSLRAIDAERLGLADLGEEGADVGDQLERVDNAIDRVNSDRSDIGAFVSNVAETAVNVLNISNANVTRSQSVISDTDVAQVASERASEAIRSDASVAMLAQANQQRTQAANLLFGLSS